MTRASLKKLILPFLLLGMLSACTTTQTTSAKPENSDPFEGINRTVFAFNQVADRAVLDPIANTYNKLPAPPRKVVRNFFRNLREPLVFVNDVLQGEFKRAGQTFRRFAINTTIGVGGTLNIAPKFGLQYHTEDFGQTFARWGFNEGPYLVIPFLGPSNLRDGVGLIGDTFADPAGLQLDAFDEKGLQLGRFLGSNMDSRARADATLDDLFNSADPYIMMRSAYLQNRRYEIRNGEPEPFDEDDLYEFDDEFYDDEEDPEEEDAPE